MSEHISEQITEYRVSVKEIGQGHYVTSFKYAMETVEELAKKFPNHRIVLEAWKPEYRKIGEFIERGIEVL